MEETILTDGKIDVKKLEPLCFDGANGKYHVMGEEVADAFKVGFQLK